MDCGGRGSATPLLLAPASSCCLHPRELHPKRCRASLATAVQSDFAYDRGGDGETIFPVEVSGRADMLGTVVCSIEKPERLAKGSRFWALAVCACRSSAARLT